MVDEVTLAESRRQPYRRRRHPAITGSRVVARGVRKSKVFVGDLASRDSYDRPGNRMAIPQPL
jgi:hypothetical protein